MGLENAGRQSQVSLQAEGPLRGGGPVRSGGRGPAVPGRGREPATPGDGARGRGVQGLSTGDCLCLVCFPFRKGLAHLHSFCSR